MDYEVLGPWAWTHKGPLRSADTHAAHGCCMFFSVTFCLLTMTVK